MSNWETVKLGDVASFLKGKGLSKDEQSWFDQVTTDSVEFYLATGYMNFIIANQAVVAGKCWKEGLPVEFQERDKRAKSILEKAFPGRKIVQRDCMPLHHDGGGLPTSVHGRVKCC